MPRNIVLIGMPGVGKSTIGVILAKYMSFNFIDTDVYIQSKEGRGLQEIIDKDGIEHFSLLEERYVLSLSCMDCVIATGGSVIYSDKSIMHLKASGIMVHLYLPFDLLKRRLMNFASRGVVIKPDQNLRDLFEERIPLYKHHENIRIDCGNLSHEEVICNIMAEIKKNKTRI